MTSAVRRRLSYARAWVRGTLIEARHRPAPGGPPDGPGTGYAAVVDLRETTVNRTLYTLARTFHDAGYQVHTSARPAYAHVLEEYGRLTRTLPGGRLGRGRTADPARTLYVTDRPDLAPDRPWRAVVTVDYDYYGAPADALFAPYSMHPLMYERGHHRPAHLAALRARPRSVGVLFAGNDKASAYSGGPVVSTFGLTPRAPLLDRLDGLMVAVPPPPSAAVQDDGNVYGTAADLTSRATPDQAVRMEGWRVGFDEFLDVIASASFFVAAPGVAMPHSHNLIEALAVGTVPITGYGHLARPALTDREAVLFSGADVRPAVERALAMSEAERTRLSEGAAAYYDEHLSAAAFGRKLEAAVAGPSALGPVYVLSSRPSRAALDA